jgi:uncharacterized protein YchJ
MKDLLKRIEYNNGEFPRKVLEEIINRKDEAIPELLEILRQVKDNPQWVIENPDYFGHIYAIYLLAQFRVEELNPLFLDLLSLPNEIPHDIFGDMITEDAGRILATTCFNNIQPIKYLIENKDVNEYVRGQGIMALTILVLHGKLQREEVLEYYRYLLNEGIKDNNAHVMAVAIYCCDVLYPEEVYEDIKRAYERKLVEEFYINLEDIEETLKYDKEDILEKSKSDHHMQFIDNIIDELEGWACFYKDREKDIKRRESQWRKVKMRRQVNTTTVVKPPKIGRNDPCPCGSGKKYKKCCGK